MLSELNPLEPELGSSTSEHVAMAQLRSVGLSPVPGVIPVLLFHSIPKTDGKIDRFSVRWGEFITHVEAIIDSGRTAITVGQLAAGLRGERRLPSRGVAITFDDVFEDTLEAVEHLRERRLCATAYVTTGKIATESPLWRARLEQLASRPESVELGAHSVRHPRLDELGIAGIEREVFGSKRQLEYFVGRRIETFAYPHGAYDRRVRAAVIDAGYRSAAAVKNALSHQNDDPWAVARWTVRSTTTAEQVARLLAGREGALAWGRERWRTRGYRVVRRARREILPGGKDWR